MKSLESENKKFFRKMSKVYDKGITGKILLSRTKNILKSIVLRKHSRVLDLGCGTGSLLNELSLTKSLRLYGLDLSLDMLNVARKKLGKRALLFRGSVHDIKNLYGKIKFDYIFIDDALHHFSNREQVLIDCYSLLSKDGRIIISDFSFGRIGNFIFHTFEKGNSGMYTPVKLKNLLKDIGFVFVKKKKIGLFSFFIEARKS